MQVDIVQNLLSPAHHKKAKEVLNACVHCGFCTATCPTYLQTGNELDSPRGRIYLIKDMLETGAASAVTQHHLDRCLTCQSCETTCPSGVEYHALLAIGRETTETLAPNNAWRKLQRALLRLLTLARPLVFAGLRIARKLRIFVPESVVRTWLPDTQFEAVNLSALAAPQASAESTSAPRVLIQSGCVQPALRPDTDRALAIVLAHFGVVAEFVTGSGCCGALNAHTGAEPQARRQAQENLAAWQAAIDRNRQSEVIAIVSSASGCGAQLSDYANLLADAPEAVAQAQRLTAKVRDPAAVIWALMQAHPERPLPSLNGKNLSFHCPCTLQHALKESGRVEAIFAQLGVPLPTIQDGHLCCGSAGSYSILQPEMARALRAEKLENLQASEPAEIMTANIGCQLHLQAGTQKPVRHWLELLAEALVNARHHS